MNLGSAFYNSSTGLKASARLADTVANNVANAMTPGFAKRTTELSSLTLSGYGSGVRINGTFRAESALLTAERRLMAAAASAAGTIGEARDRLLAAVGEPGSPAALATRATAFETALLAAAASPSSTPTLGTAIETARSFVTAIASASNEAAAIRTEAEAEILRQVDLLNRSLAQVEDLNRKIQSGIQQGQDVGGLEDERGRVIDRISEIVPVRTVKREQGQIAIFTAGGGLLLDGRAYPLGFERSAAIITPESPYALNGLTQFRGAEPWDPVPVNVANGLMDGGSLAALFEVRDRVAVEALAELDAFALDLMDRFRTDPPVPAGALDGLGRGLFFDPAGTEGQGIAARLAINPAVDPLQGGQLFRLRDGLDATAPGPEGFGAYLQGLADAMVAPRNPGLASTTVTAGSAGLAAEIGAFLGSQAARADDARAFLSGQRAILMEREAGEIGVDSDAELQFLMLVEQAYAANARVLSVIDSLLKQLLEI
jgi:flagellar hook-associated protein 1